MFDGTCFKLKDGKYLECKSDGGEEVFTDVYLGQLYEVDANNYAYERVKKIFGESEELRNLYDFWMPKKPVPDETYAAYYDLIDLKAKYGIKGAVDKKLSANLEELKAKGYPFTCKIFEDMGHGGLIGENTERFIEEVDAVHLQSNKETDERS